MRSLLFFVAIASILPLSRLSAQSPKLPELLPATTVLYVEGLDSQSVLQLPLVDELIKSPLFRQLWNTPDAMKLRGGITLAEVALGERLPESLAKLTGQGWALALDRQTQGVVFWARTRDNATCEELYKKLLSIAEMDAKSKGRDVKQVAYREVNAYEVNGTVIARLDHCLAVSNKGEFVKSLVDRWREPSAPADTLAGNQRFADYARGASPQPSGESKRLAHAWLDIQQLHDAGLAKKLFVGPHDNFAAELLLGGVIAALRGAPTLEATFDVEQKQLHVSLQTPLSKSAVTNRYEYFFGPNAGGQAPPVIQLKGAQANVCLYRDIAQLWQHAGDLFGQKTNDQLAQAETTLTTLFSGRDFASDILGSIRPELQLIVAAQEFGQAGRPVPQVKLPAFALVTRLRDPQTMQPQMKRIFMSLIGFANVAGAMNEQPQLDIESFRLEGGWEIAATYAIDADRPKDWIVPVQFNFSPTLLMVGEYAVISSTQALAGAIREQLQNMPEKIDTASTLHRNSMVHLDGELISQAIEANREQLISQNMIEKGHNKEEATAEIELLLNLIKLVKSLDLSFSVGNQAQLNVNISCH